MKTLFDALESTLKLQQLELRCMYGNKPFSELILYKLCCDLLAVYPLLLQYNHTAISVYVHWLRSFSVLGQNDQPVAYSW